MLDTGLVKVGQFVVLSIQVNTRHLPTCMSGAAVLKQACYFNRVESDSLVQTSVHDVFPAKPSDSQQVLLSVIF